MTQDLKARDDDSFYLDGKLVDVQLIKSEVSRKATGAQVHKLLQATYRLKAVASDLLYGEAQAQGRRDDVLKLLDSLGYSWKYR